MLELNKLYLGDCLGVMPREIEDKSVDILIPFTKSVNRYMKQVNETNLVKKYIDGNYSLREIGALFDIDHHRVKRILINFKIEIKKPDKRDFSLSHRENISKSCKGREVWSKGKKMSRDHVLKNMRAHLKYDISLEWLTQFNDLEKLKYLNRSISRKRDCDGFTTEIYIKFIERFYNDEKFNTLYNKWITSKNKWIKPSLDHINPKSNQCILHDINNLQFISWLENRAKVNISQSDWDIIKKNINYYL